VELLTGLRNLDQSPPAMARYAKDTYRQQAFRERLLVACIGNIIGFDADLRMVHGILILRGVGCMDGCEAEHGPRNSKPCGAVEKSVAFALDASEDNVSRVVLDERTSLGDVTDRLLAKIIFNMLLGGTSGLITRAEKIRQNYPPRKTGMRI
jgi:hypothetical protein